MSGQCLWESASFAPHDDLVSLRFHRPTPQADELGTRLAADTYWQRNESSPRDVFSKSILYRMSQQNIRAHSLSPSSFPCWQKWLKITSQTLDSTVEGEGSKELKNIFSRVQDITCPVQAVITSQPLGDHLSGGLRRGMHVCSQSDNRYPKHDNCVTWSEKTSPSMIGRYPLLGLTAFSYHASHSRK